MKAEEAKKIENKLVETSLIFTVFVCMLLLALAYFLRDSLDWRLSIGLACVALILQFGIVEPGIRKTCRNLANEKKA